MIDNVSEDLLESDLDDEGSDYKAEEGSRRRRRQQQQRSARVSEDEDMANTQPSSTPTADEKKKKKAAIAKLDEADFQLDSDGGVILSEIEHEMVLMLQGTTTTTTATTTHHEEERIDANVVSNIGMGRWDIADYLPEGVQDYFHIHGNVLCIVMYIYIYILFSVLCFAVVQLFWGLYLNKPHSSFVSCKYALSLTHTCA